MRESVEITEWLLASILHKSQPCLDISSVCFIRAKDKDRGVCVFHSRRLIVARITLATCSLCVYSEYDWSTHIIHNLVYKSDLARFEDEILSVPH